MAAVLQKMTMPEPEPEPVVKPNLKLHRPEPDPRAVVRADLETEFTEDLLAKMFANLAAHGMTPEDLAVRGPDVPRE